ncbi:uncharacterized protein LOC134268845 [Saccostrea cucullata]|uniref:uncharacterized protein LOC134268845 n=1 Tax=Saccostrea cuccullata TaxID=36930 RepID=UPI002ED4CEFA
MCEACVMEHLSDSSRQHIIIPYKDKSPATNYPKCPHHSQRHCNFYCYECDIPACYTCISSGKHHQHNISDIIWEVSSKTEDIKRDLNELENNIYFIYEEIASDIKANKVNLEKHSEKLTAAVTKQGEVLHREIDIIVNKQKSEIDDTKTKLMIALNQQEKEIKQKLSELDKSILNLKKILESCDVSLTSAYKSRNDEFRILPPKINVSLPESSFPNINIEKIHQMFGSLSTFSISREEHGYFYLKKIREYASRPPVKNLLDEPELITTIETGYIQISVACLSDEEIWTRGNVNIMKLFNLQGELLKSIQTRSGNKPRDLAVTKDGELVYTDTNSRTVNIVKNSQMQELIRLERWKPFNVCFSANGDILVTMDNDKTEQSRVVRYSGSTEKTIIQFDSEGVPLYSYDCLKYMSENRNLDICVADNGAKALVVVNQAGKLRFRYTGNPSSTTKLFEPLGITTDSQSQILTSDGINFYIHILDQDGQFLRYIENCHLNHPLGLCVDTRDNLFVVELLSGKGSVSCPPVKHLLDEPEIINTFDTGYTPLYSVSCLNNEEIWTCGYDKIMKLYNLQGKLLKSIQTKSGNMPYDIAVTRSGQLVYTDPGLRTVNILKIDQLQEVVRLQGWRPYNVCITSSGHLLIIMDSDNDKQSKIVRYSGFTEKQTIQFDSEGKPLYSSHLLKYISENRNLDICVADSGAKTLVVVNQEGKLRFRYTGHPSTDKGSFGPWGITTDSQSQILTADSDNHCIHILDQDGQFLRFIENCDLQRPILCVDTRDNLIVAEYYSGKVKKIKYMKQCFNDDDTMDTFVIGVLSSSQSYTI